MCVLIWGHLLLERRLFVSPAQGSQDVLQVGKDELVGSAVFLLQEFVPAEHFLRADAGSFPIGKEEVAFRVDFLFRNRFFVPFVKFKPASFSVRGVFLIAFPFFSRFDDVLFSLVCDGVKGPGYQVVLYGWFSGEDPGPFSFDVDLYMVVPPFLLLWLQDHSPDASASVVRHGSWLGKKTFPCAGTSVDLCFYANNSFKWWIVV